MSIAYVQSNSVGFAGRGSRSLTYLTNTTLGNFLIASMSGGGSSCSDTAGNTWVATGTGLWYCSRCVGGPTTVTISGSEGVQAMTVGEFSGVNAYDTGSLISGAGPDAIWKSPPLTTSYISELCIAVVSNGYGNLGIDSPFTTLGSGENYFRVGYYIAPTFQTGLICTGSNGNGNGNNLWGCSLDGFYQLGVTGITVLDSITGSPFVLSIVNGAVDVTPS